jgi:hypothetical protein
MIFLLLAARLVGSYEQRCTTEFGNRECKPRHGESLRAHPFHSRGRDYQGIGGSPLK